MKIHVTRMAKTNLPPHDKTAPGIRAWDSARCEICRDPMSNHNVTILERRNTARMNNRRFHTSCYKKLVDGNDWDRVTLNDPAICSYCKKPLGPGVSFVHAKEGLYNRETSLYVMHGECFEETAGPDFWDLDLFKVFNPD